MIPHRMRAWPLGLALTLMWVIASAADTVHWDLKPGLWETTSTGQASIPDDVLQKMPPKRREQMQAIERAAVEGLSTPFKSCLTPEKLAGEFLRSGTGPAGCQRYIVSSTSSEFTAVATCNKGVIRIHFQRISHEEVTGTTVIAGGEMNVEREIRMKWLSASCGDTH
jgi:hypothetical protein